MKGLDFQLDTQPKKIIEFGCLPHYGFSLSVFSVYILRICCHNDDDTDEGSNYSFHLLRLDYVSGTVLLSSPVGNYCY